MKASLQYRAGLPAPPSRPIRVLAAAAIVGFGLTAASAGPGKTRPPASPQPGKPKNGTPAPPGAPPGAPGAPAPVNGAPDGMIRLDFRGTDIDVVLQAFHMAYRWTIVKDPAVTGPVTIIESNPMDQKRALEVLRAVLEVRGFTAQLDGNVLKVTSLARAVRSPGPVRVPGGEQFEDQQVLTDVISLSNAEANVLAKDLEPLLGEGAKIIAAAGANALIITDTAANIARLRTIIQSLDRGAGNNEMQIFRLKHVPAKKMTEIINDLFKQIAPRAPAAPMGQPGQPQPFPEGQPGAPRRAEPRPAVAAVDDERTNSVIVVGSADNLKRVEEIVRRLDEELNPHTETKVYEVKYADASRLAELVNSGLLGGQETSRQPPSGGFNPFNPFGAQPMQGGTKSYSAGQTKIVADTRPNKLIITADEDTMKLVEDLLVRLDQPVEYETTTFVIPLKNVNSDDMAYVLARAFGTQERGFNDFPFFFFGDSGSRGGTARRDRRIRRRLDGEERSDASGGAGPDTPASGFRPGAGEPDRIAANDLPDDLDELPPGARRLAQFFYDYYYGGRGRGSEATTGRNAEGRYVNLLQLRNNVLVTSERNTNSLIITTSPENAQAVRDLVAQLDVEVKQVLLEAIVAEVTLDREVKFGVDYLFQDLRNKVEGVFPALPSRGRLGPDRLASGLRYTIFSGDFQAVLTMLGKDERVRILSTPRVFTANNQEAEIEVTDTVPYLGGTTVGFGTATSSNTQFRDVGLILNVRPRITADGMVAVDVYQEDSNLIDFRAIGEGVRAPFITQRVTDTSVTLRDGDTLVLGGLQKTAVRDVVNKIPILGDIPLIGRLFSSTSKRRQRTELVVFLTPRVVNGADEAKRLTDQELERVQKKLPEARPTVPPVR